MKKNMIVFDNGYLSTRGWFWQGNTHAGLYYFKLQLHYFLFVCCSICVCDTFSCSKIGQDWVKIIIN